MESFRAVILGGDENAYGAARLFYEINGEKPLLICTRLLPFTEKSTILELEIVPKIDTPEIFREKLPAILEREREKHGRVFLIPCADYYAALCIKHASLLEELIENRFISEELYDKLETKDKFSALCAEYGLAHPRTVIIDCAERESAAEKPRRGSQSREACRCI